MAKRTGRSVPSWGPTSQDPKKTGWMQQTIKKRTTVTPQNRRAGASVWTHYSPNSMVRRVVKRSR